QYKLEINPEGYSTPVVQSVGIDYEMNKPPEIKNVLAYQIQDRNSADLGKVLLTYEVKDVDTSHGVNYPGQVLPKIEYKVGESSDWADASVLVFSSSPILRQGDISLKEVNESSYTTHEAVLDVKNIVRGHDSSISGDDLFIRVTVDDGENIHNLSSASSEGISIDTKIPYFENEKLSATLDAGIVGVENSALIKIKRPIESSGYIEYRVVDFRSNANGEMMDTGWVEMVGDEVSVPWSFDSQINSKIAGVRFRDLFNNEDANNIVTLESPDPIYEKSFVVQDVSNVETHYYAMYLGWLKMSYQNFSHFKIEKFISPDGTNFYKEGEVEDGVLSDVNTDFYLYKNLTPSFIHKFLISVVDIYGNVSVRQGNDLIVKADGLQNYGEGGGGVLNQSAIINNVIVAQNNERNVVVTYKITDSTVYEKDNPSFEEYLFYYNGLTLSDNPYDGTSLKLSNSSGLKDSGYVLINNEVIKYNNRNNNTIGGLVLGTWPNLVSEGRETRQNTDFFAGTPVWVMADNTTPNSFDYSDYYLEDGENMSILWNTFNETGLMGGNYDNLGIRVVAHDNSEPNFSPLSTQNDYSEDGLLQTLDLTAPSVSFEVSGIATSENGNNFPVNIILDRPYVFDASIDYSISGSASYGLDHSMINGSITIPSGTTTTTLNIPIIDDIVKENSETILVALKNPINTKIGSNNIFTLTIEDNDSSPNVGFSLSTVSNTENITSVKIPITLSEVSEIDVIVSYVVSGSATSESDFSLASGNITILKGEDEANIDLTIIDDTKKENDETVIVKLTGATGANLNSDTTYIYTIIDNDTYPTLSFASLTSQAKEDVNTANILVSVSSPYPEDIKFNYSVTGGSADGNGIDYLVEEYEGIISAGSTNVNIPVVIFDDELSEETENVLITLSNPTNAVLGSDIIHAFSILDNEILVSDINGASVKSTSARIVWTTADYTDSLIEYGTIREGEEGAYSVSKQSLDKVLNHNIYIDNLTPETTYYFRTTSTNLAGETTISRSQFITTPGPIITSVASLGETDTGATITWTTNIPSNSVVSYSINPDMSSSSTVTDEVLSTEHSVSLTGLVPNEIYYFLVMSSDELGNTGEGANGGSYYTFSTNDDETAPIISDISTPIRTNSQVAVTWTTNEPADGRVLYGKTSGDYSDQTELIYTLVTNHLATISELEESTQYYYVIKSTDENGNETTSDEYSFETTAKEKVIISKGGGGITGVAQELYDLLLAENQAYKAKFSTLDSIAPEISNIEISDITAFGASISFNTNEDTIAFIKYGKEGDYGLTSADDNWSQRHIIKLNGLSLGTLYNFKISAMDKSNDIGNSENQKFTTKYLSEDLSELKKIDNVEQFQKEIETTIESILPSLVPPFIDKPEVVDITESGATIKYRTNVKAFPVVSYVEDEKYDSSKENPYNGESSNTLEKSTSHFIKLIGLKSNT
ncbi:MAG: Calx-beta domain-containing protein, partial [Lachnospiraceae bacterium]|nr:Calx-beta domain-containing protein [Lachnospiraceae bacterium]